MRKIAVALAILGTTLLTALYTAPAQAQATRTWVSGVGDDANPCSRTAPCKTFAGAISKTAAGGEIDNLDTGGFGALTITKAITIDGGGAQVASVLVSGTPGITVAAGSSDVVILRNLKFQGIGSGTNGVSITSGKLVILDRCDIMGFTQNGVNMASSSSGARVIIRSSTIVNNSGGVNVTGTGNIASITSTDIDANTSFGVQANGSGTILGIANSVINASPTAISLLNGGSAYSFGPSNLVSGSGSFTATLPFN